MDDDKLATFDEFLKALVDHTPNALVQNNHWQSFGSLCFPCDVKYDYIMKLDTINEDSDFLFQTLGRLLLLRFINSKMPNFEKYFSNITRTIKLFLRSLLLCVYQHLKSMIFIKHVNGSFVQDLKKTWGRNIENFRKKPGF